MPEPLRDVIARHGLQATKALGQNFILDRQLLARIAAIPGSLEGASVYEVGPGPGGLTPREVEVLRLVAAGKSNAEIADALVLSVRTAERHMGPSLSRVQHKAMAPCRLTRP